MKTNVVKINLWETTVGYIYWDKKRRQAIFQYDEAYIEEGLDIAPLTMPVRSERSRKGMVWYGETGKLYQGLPSMIADSLPDHWGNAIFSAWLRDNGIKSSDTDPVDRLSFIGKRGMGALEFEPAQSLGKEGAFDVDVQRLYLFSQEVLSAREAITLNEEQSVLWQDLIKLGTSPGGKRPKAIISIHPGTNEIKSGQADIPEGFTHYMLKYDGGTYFPSAKMEYIYYKMAISAGIKMMPSILKEFGGSVHFLTQRFDRNGNEKIHTQTLAAIYPDSDSYDDLFKVIRQLGLEYQAIEQQYLRMVFNVLGRNVDDHSKNFSFCMDKNGKWSLSPAYDVTYSVDNTVPAYMNRQSLLVNGKNSDITTEDMLETGIRNDIRNPQKLIDQVKTALSTFSIIAKETDIRPEIIEMVNKEIRF